MIFHIYVSTFKRKQLIFCIVYDNYCIKTPQGNPVYRNMTVSLLQDESDACTQPYRH